MAQRKRPAGVVATFTLLACAIVIAVGCSEQQVCGGAPLADVAYDTTLSVAPLVDSVVVYIGGDWAFGAHQDMKVYFDTEPAADSDIRFGLHVVGEAATEDTRAVIAHSWSGDTLRVWCGRYEPRIWNKGLNSEKCSPAMPWLAPSRVDIAVPTGVNVHYAGRWSPGG